MVKKTSLIKWLVLFLVVCVLIVIVFVIFLPPAEREQSPVDYVAEYNRISKPADFDPNENAAPYFDKAFELMVEMPDELEQIKKRWPGDMNDYQLQTAGQWVEANRQSINYIKQAVSKPYCWKPAEVNENESLLMMDTNDLKLFRNAAYLLCMDAKLKAYGEQTEPALRELVDVYKMGTFFTDPKILIEQLVGIAISGLAVKSAFQVLEHTNPSPDILEDFQRRIASLFSNQPFLIDLAGERLMFYDVLGRYYAGHDQNKPGMSVKKFFLRTIGHTWEARERRKADMLYNYLATAAHKTPWQLHSEGNDVSSVTEEIVKGTYFVKMFAPAFDKLIFISHRAQVHTDALIAVTAILRYKADKGRYPKDLQQLVDSGYLEKLPMDPFSGGALVYNVTDGNFELYSFAQDFDDDGGKHDSNWADKSDGDFVFWPVQKDK